MSTIESPTAGGERDNGGDNGSNNGDRDGGGRNNGWNGGGNNGWDNGQGRNYDNRGGYSYNGRYMHAAILLLPSATICTLPETLIDLRYAHEPTVIGSFHCFTC